MQDMKGRVALVTASAMGIGAGIALALAERGCTVVLMDLESQKGVADDLLKQLAKRGATAAFIGCDGTNRNQVEKALDECIARFGSLDVLVSCIGGNPKTFPRTQFLDEPFEHVMGTVNMTLFAGWHIAQLAARRMLGFQEHHVSSRPAVAPKKTRAIVFIGSIMADWTRPGASGYSMSKAALRQLSRTMAAELGPHGIRVNCVQPGWIDTPGERKVHTQAQMDAVAKVLPLGRLGTPQDVGQMVAFLCSEQASYVTGAVITVDGGYLTALDIPGATLEPGKAKL